MKSLGRILPGRIEPQRIVACLLVLLQSVALGYFCKTLVFTPIVIVAVLVGTNYSPRSLPMWLAKRLPILLPLMFVVQRTLLPTAWSGGGFSLLVPGACLIAQYFVIYQVALFWVRSDDDRSISEHPSEYRNSLPSYFPILAITAMVFTGDVQQVDDRGRVLFQLMTIALVLLTIAFYFTSRLTSVGERPVRSRGHTRWLIGIGLVCCLTGWVSGSGLYRYAREIEDTINRFVNPSLRPESMGFSGNGRIGSVSQQKSNAGERVAIRVFAADSPGYLRGKVFDTYTSGQWQRQASTRAVAPISDQEITSDVTEAMSNLDSKNPLDSFFRLSDQGPVDPAGTLEVWPAQSFGDVVFTPLDIVTLAAPVDGLTVDAHGGVRADAMPNGARYVVLRTQTDSGITSEQRRTSLADQEMLTTFPAKLDSRIDELAERIVGDAVSVGDKIAALVSFFNEYYEYEFGIDVPSDGDPVEYFLLQRPPAHCEYFASGAAMLLRSLGVPCRYVTGFVAAEENSVGGYWVARNRDAHAWVEAFDPQRGWVIVEATPAGGVPDATSSSTTNQSWDALRSRWQRMIAAIRAGGLTGVIAMIRRWVLHPWTLGGIALGLLGWAIRYFRNRRGGDRLDVDADPRVRRMRQSLWEMDERWRRAGLPRHEHETMHQFASRLESAAEVSEHVGAPQHAESASWYRRFASIRYSGRLDDFPTADLPKIG